MKYPTALFALAWTTSSAFHVVPTMQVARRRVILQDTSVQPPPIDKARAQYCAENVGACSVDEMEEMRELLHQERVQNFMYGGSGGAKADDGSLEDLVLEEELDMQLKMLKQATPNPSLFPEVEDKMAELPHLKDNTESSAVEKILHEAEHDLAIAESVLEESTLETLAMCSVVMAVIFFGPQLVHF